MEEQKSNLDFADNVGNKIQPNQINDCLMDFINGGKGVTRSVIDSVTSLNKWNVSDAVEFKHNDKNITMHAVPSLDGKEVASAYFTDYKGSANVLLMEDAGNNVFVLKTEAGEPMLEFTYDHNTNKAKCTKVCRKEKLEDYLCNGAMAVLGWEVAIVLSVPSGGSSLLFGVLWSIVTVSYCD